MSVVTKYAPVVVKVAYVPSSNNWLKAFVKANSRVVCPREGVTKREERLINKSGIIMPYNNVLVEVMRCNDRASLMHDACMDGAHAVSKMLFEFLLGACERIDISMTSPVRY